MPTLTENEMKEVVIAALHEAQERRGRAWNELGEDDTPIGFLDEFDSLCSLDVTLDIEAKLDVTFHVASLFFVTRDGRPLTLRETIAKMAMILAKQSAA